MMHTFTVLASLSLVYAATHEIDVGESGLTFDPQTFTAQPGDTLIFHLYPSHDVVQGDFSSPCTPSSNGFYSGPFSQTDNGKKRFVVTVNSSDAMYWYCSVPQHCQGGMVGGINLPGSGNTIDAYASAAKNVQKSTAPSSESGGKLIDESDISSAASSAAGSTATAGSASASGSSSATTTPSSGSSSTTAPASQSSAGSSSGSAASASPTGAADIVTPDAASGALAAFLGLAAWLL